MESAGSFAPRLCLGKGFDQSRYRYDNGCDACEELRYCIKVLSCSFLHPILSPPFL